MTDWKKSWWRLPLLPFRVVFLGLAYYVLEPLRKVCEAIGGVIPGLKRK